MLSKILNKNKHLILIIVGFNGYASVYASLRVNHARSVTHSVAKVKRVIGKLF